MRRSRRKLLAMFLVLVMVLSYTAPLMADEGGALSAEQGIVAIEESTPAEDGQADPETPAEESLPEKEEENPDVSLTPAEDDQADPETPAEESLPEEEAENPDVNLTLDEESQPEEEEENPDVSLKPAGTALGLTLADGEQDNTRWSTLLAKAETLTAAAFTTAGAWEAFQDKLTGAKAVFEAPEAEQEAIDAAASELEAAMQKRTALPGDGKAGAPYLIADVYDLFIFAHMIDPEVTTIAATYNYNAAAYYQLTDDIDLTGRTWTPAGDYRLLGVPSYTFNFDGDNKTITGLTAPLFNWVAAGISNLTIKDSNIAGSGAMGAIAATLAGGAIDNCHLVDSTVSTDTRFDYYNYQGRGVFGGVGGLVGELTSYAVNSDNEGISGTDNVGKITNSSVTGTKNAQDEYSTVVQNAGKGSGSQTYGGNTGGIVGVMTYEAEVADCYVSEVLVKNFDSRAGGIAGVAGAPGTTVTVDGVNVNSPTPGGTVSGCWFNGRVECPKEDGYTGNTYGQFVGGIMGAIAGPSTIVDCVSAGSLGGVAYVGGIIGGVDFSTLTASNRYAATIDSCYTTMSIERFVIEGEPAVNGRYGGLVGLIGEGLDSSARLDIVNSRALNPGVTDLYRKVNSDASVSMGALYSDMHYSATARCSGVTVTGTYAWEYMALDKTPVGYLAEGDYLYDTGRNGEDFVSYAALRVAAGWPAGMTSGSGKWTYSAGSMPVLTKFAGKMSAEIPDYLKKNPLQNLIDETDGITNGPIRSEDGDTVLFDTTYWADGWTVFQAELAAAKVVAGNAGASFEQMKAAYDKLVFALEELERRDAPFRGKGRADKPFLIDGKDALLAMAELVNGEETRDEYRKKHYKMTSDVVLLAGDEWVMIGGTANTTAFEGTFDGGGHSIAGLTKSLFGWLRTPEALVKNLTLQDVDIVSGSGFLGAVAAQLQNGVIDNCKVIGGTITHTGNVRAATNAQTTAATGGIVGNLLDAGEVRNSFVAATIRSGCDGVGGIAGQMRMNVSGDVGPGVIGCYFKGGVYATNNSVQLVGGIAGVTNGTISNALTGSKFGPARINDCISAGVVAGNTGTGGLIGGLGLTASSYSVMEINRSYTTAVITRGDYATTAMVNMGGILGTGANYASINGDGMTGTPGFRVTDTMALNERIFDTYLSIDSAAATAMGARHGGTGGGNSGYPTLTPSYTNTWAWDGVELNTNPVMYIESTDTRFSSQAFRSGNLFASYARLQSHGVSNWPGWGAAMTGNYESASNLAEWRENSLWTYTEGQMPVLKAFANPDDSGEEWYLDGEFPEFLTTSAIGKLVKKAQDFVEAYNDNENPDGSGKYFREDTWANLKTMLQKANELDKNPNSDPEDVKAAYMKLLEAMEILLPFDLTMEGFGTADNPFIVRTAAQLREMSALINDPETGGRYRDKYFGLGQDIVMDDLEGDPGAPNFTSIGKIELPFTGVFDGNDHTISNLRIEGDRNVGLFGAVNGGTIATDTTVIKNVTIKDSKIEGKARFFEDPETPDRYIDGINVGGIVGLYGSNRYLNIDNCHVVDSDISGYAGVGGIAGNGISSSIGVEIINCTVASSKIYGSGEGYFVNTATASQLTGGYQEIYARQFIGGVFGGGGTRVNGTHSNNNNSPSVSGCRVTDTEITGNYNVGGVAGYAGAITGCVVDGCVITAEKDDYDEAYGSTGVAGASAGGIVPSAAGALSGNRVIDTEIAGGRLTGGLAGRSSQTLSNNAVINTAVKGQERIGGLVGMGGGTMNGNYFSGTITSRGGSEELIHAGGVIGFISANANINDSVSEGIITGKNFIGGIIGSMGPSESGYSSVTATVNRVITTMTVNGVENSAGLAGGYRGDRSYTYPSGSSSNTGKTITVTGTLTINDSLVLSKGLNIENIAYFANGVIHGFGNTARIIVNNTKAWDAMALNGQSLGVLLPQDVALVNYNELVTAAGWPSALFTDGTGLWSYAEREMPALKAIEAMDGNFPLYLTAPGFTATVRLASATKGQTVKFPIVVTDNPGIFLFGLKVGFDSDYLSLKDVVDGGILSAMNWDKDSNVLRWTDTMAVQDYKENGVIATLVFEVKAEAPVADYPITLSLTKNPDTNEDESMNWAREYVPVKFENGVLKVVGAFNATFIYDSGETPDLKKDAESDGKVIAPADPAKSHEEGYGEYKFLGWYEAGVFEAGGEPFDFGAELTEDVRLYTEWAAPGSEANPYEISSYEELVEYSGLINGADTRGWYKGQSYVLTSDFTVPGNAPVFTPMGGSLESAVFTGNFDGQGHTVTGLVIKGGYYTGMFAYTKYGTIKNINLANVTVESTDGSSGAIVGYAGDGARIENCFVTGKVTGAGTNVGGIAGYATTGSSGCLTDCVFIGDVICSMTGTSASNVGGIAGNVSTAIKNSYFYGNVSSSNSTVGGIAGNVASNANYKIENSYAFGTVSGSSIVGGIAGAIGALGSIVDSYAMNDSVKATSTTGIAARMVGSKAAGNGTITGFALDSMVVTAPAETVPATAIAGDPLLAAPYTEASWEAFSTALSAAKAALGSGSPAQDAVLAAMSDLESALKGLKGEATVKPGDVNGDGEINLFDLLAVIDHITGEAVLEGNSFLASDVNGDGEINLFDILAIIDHITGEKLIEN